MTYIIFSARNRTETQPPQKFTGYELLQRLELDQQITRTTTAEAFTREVQTRPNFYQAGIWDAQTIRLEMPGIPRTLEQARESSERQLELVLYENLPMIILYSEEDKISDLIELVTRYSKQENSKLMLIDKEQEERPTNYLVRGFLKFL